MCSQLHNHQPGFPTTAKWTPVTFFEGSAQQPRVTVLLPEVLSTARLPKHGEADTAAARVR